MGETLVAERESIIPTPVRVAVNIAGVIAVAKFLQPSAEMAVQHYRSFREARREQSVNETEVEGYYEQIGPEEV